MDYYTVKQLYPWLYRFFDPMNAYFYLILGEESALLYDTGHGMGPIMPAIGKITDLPLDVVLSHGHADHAGGAYQFEYVWMDEADKEVFLRHNGKTGKGRALGNMEAANIDKPPGFDAWAYIHSGTTAIKPLAHGQTFELGGITAEILPMEGHTQGSVGVLLKEKRQLLTGDAASPHVWMFLNESTNMAAYIAMLERVHGLDFDSFFAAHYEKEFAKDCFQRFISAAKNAGPENSSPFNRLPELKGLIYQEDGAAVVFREDKL